MAQRIESIEATLLYGHFYLKHRFTPGVNIIYGHNGGGKTTLLNILANVLGGNFDRFAFLDFSIINIEFDDGKVLVISRNQPLERYDEEYIEVRLDDELLEAVSISQTISSMEISPPTETNLPSVIYFPAYRILYDYLYLSKEEQNQKLLSPFAPPIYFPSINEIEETLRNLGGNSEIPENINLFANTVNKFFEKKKIMLKPNTNPNPFEIRYEDGYVARSLSSLSSGERQITTIFFAISQLKSDGIVLLDEPEISLHIDWQRKILRSISQTFDTEQIIVCTHSPVIGGDFEMSELEFRFAG